MKSLIRIMLATSLALFTQTIAVPLEHDFVAKRNAVAETLNARLAAPEAGGWPPPWKREAEPEAEPAPELGLELFSNREADPEPKQAGCFPLCW